jgi:polysaccharide biosynthesis/export protein
MRLYNHRGTVIGVGALALFAALTIANASAATQHRRERFPETPPLSSGPRLGKVSVDDVLRIAVDRERDLSGRYRVDATGSIDYPLAGRLTVSGMKPGAVAKLIAEKLKGGYLKDPKVSVEIERPPAVK